MEGGARSPPHKVNVYIRVTVQPRRRAFQTGEHVGNIDGMLSFPPGRTDAGASPAAGLLLPPVILTSTRVSAFLCCLNRRSWWQVGGDVGWERDLCRSAASSVCPSGAAVTVPSGSVEDDSDVCSDLLVLLVSLSAALPSCTHQPFIPQIHTWDRVGLTLQRSNVPDPKVSSGPDTWGSI